MPSSFFVHKALSEGADGRKCPWMWGVMREIPWRGIAGKHLGVLANV